MDELLAEFIAETRETLTPLAGEVVAWEQDPSDRGRLDAIFRFVHTVKGSCGFLDLPRLERLSHAAEGALAEVRAERRMPDVALVSAVLAIIDRIGEMVEALDAGETYPEGGDDALILALEPGREGAAAPAAGASAMVPTAPRAAARSIRLPVELLDRMMGGVSDMVLARNELSRRLRDAGGDTGVEAAFERLSACVAEMRNAITRTRMQRVENLFTALPRMVRDLAADLGKVVTVSIEGNDVELDREMIEMIRDPLTHIIRNAVDHGIEPPSERSAAGKPMAGSLRVSARQAGNQILIDVADDGRGIDGERLVAKAIAAGILTAEDAAHLGKSRKLALVFEPGLSTASAVTAISGRGVGMDVVRANVERIGGVVDIDSQLRRGTRLTLRVPLTLTIIPALTIGVGGLHYAIPRPAIEEIVRVSPGTVSIERIGGTDIACVRGSRIPVIHLRQVFGAEHRAPMTLIILRPAGGERFAMAVDAVLDHEELVIKPAAPAVMATGLYAGTTLPDTGRPMLLLDPAGIAAAAGVRLESGARAAASDDAVQALETVSTLLFLDLDGAERAVRLGLVDRIEDVPGSAIRFAAGATRLTHDGRILPLVGCAPDRLPALGESARVRVLLLNDGSTEIGYAIDRIIDIRELSPAVTAAAEPGLIAGLLLIEGRPVELIDPHWLFEQTSAAIRPAEPPLCILHGADDRWMREVLKPMVEAAGYRVGWAGSAEQARAAVVLASVDQPVASSGDAAVVRLRTAPASAGPQDNSIYRYDRTGLLQALAAGAGRRG